jgi:dipeptidase D
MNDIRDLEPKSLWNYFYEITRIPRPSKKEKKITEFILRFAAEHKLESLVDKAGNVIIRKSATKGMENRQGVILQAHLDMVPQKNSDKVHDFEKDPIEAIVDGEWVRANGPHLDPTMVLALLLHWPYLHQKMCLTGHWRFYLQSTKRQE